MRSQIARLTDALVRATQKAKLKDSLLAETQNKLRDAKENALKVAKPWNPQAFAFLILVPRLTEFCKDEAEAQNLKPRNL